MPHELHLTGIHKDINFVLAKEFVHNGFSINRGEWQALHDDRPQTKVVELYDVSIDTSVPDTVEEWQEFCQPNLPWAEDHFQERISGEPLNPGEQYKNWPWYQDGWEAQNSDGTFSHTYMERMWTEDNDYGTIEDLIHLLIDRPYTRQAFHTIWWPNDTMNAKRGERVPCSLGYLFQMQQGALECYYYLRSCDYIRYMWDDIYMAGRLLQFMVKSTSLPLGQLHTKIANLHIFQDEMPRVRREYEDQLSERMNNAF